MSEPETWGDGNPRVPGETFDDYNQRMARSLANLGEPLARHPDGSLNTDPVCICRVPALLKHQPCVVHWNEWD